MHSFCVKTHHNYILNYLLYEFENSNIDNLYVSKHKFKIYPNIILHYLGKDISSFYAFLAGSLTNIIIRFYEKHILKCIIFSNYFYFSDIERNQILEYCIDLLNASQNDRLHCNHLIFSSCFDYVKHHNVLILDGFIHFRLKDYWKTLDDIVDISVDKFVLEREYNEFISLLKMYINSRKSVSPILHLVYHNNESILLDDKKQLIDISSHVFDAKYLSDISFSSNDYALNALLSLLPEKLYVHLVSKTEDEFICTLKLIFENRLFICDDCPICHLYQLSDSNLHKLT